METATVKDIASAPQDERLGAVFSWMSETDELLMWAVDPTAPSKFFVMRENKGAVEPFVTHLAVIGEDGKAHFVLGHYFKTKAEAILDFLARVIRA